MVRLTNRQRQILEFIQDCQNHGFSPSLREIARHFQFRSMTTAVDHVRLLRQKGALTAEPRKARTLRLCPAEAEPRHPITAIPIFGSIPAGLPESHEQQSEGCLSIDLESLGIKPSPRTFALRVTGDSMIGRHILPGDIVVLEHGREPRSGQVVAALMDGESTLKTYLIQKRKPFLRAENPKYPDLIPAEELVIQGVMVALVRRAKEL